MSFFKHIAINAGYETRILLRSWFFRIFAILALLSLITTNIIFYSDVAPVPRFMRGLDSMMPYATVYMLNFVLMALAVFLATDICKRDRKFNSSTVIFARSLSNAALILGRAAGLLVVFFGLQIIALPIALLINGPFSDLEINWLAYFFYPLALSLPALLVAIGLSFVLMQIIPNQAIVVIIALGILGGTGFYLYDAQYQLFDIPAIYFPLLISDFTGLGHGWQILLQRGLWLLFGLWCLALSILSFRRLPQAIITRRLIALLAVVAPLLMAWGGYSYVRWHADGEKMRAVLAGQLKALEQKDNLTLTKYDLSVLHEGRVLRVDAALTLTNDHNRQLDTLFLLLNPGMQLDSFPADLTVHRNGALLTVTRPGSGWAAGDSQRIEISYAGRPEERILYPHVKEADRLYNTHIWFFRMTRQHLFAGPEYLLLTAPSLWYPQTQSPYIREMLIKPSHFSLTVQTAPELTVIAPGRADSLAAGKTAFRDIPPAKSLPLIAGRYVKQSVETKRGPVQLYHHPQHNYYKPYFNEIGDTLGPVLDGLFDEMETRLQLNYPYQRLTIVETPLMYFDYPRHGMDNPDMRHPEQLWLPENGASIPATYFKNQRERQDRRGRWTNETLTDKEAQIDLFKRFVLPTFMGGRSWGFGGDDDLIGNMPDLNAWPLFFSKVVTLGGDGRQLAVAFESYLQLEADESEGTSRWWRGGLTKAEEANLALQQKTLQEWLETGGETADLVQSHLGNFLIEAMQQALGDEEFKTLVRSLAGERRFKVVDSDSLAQRVLQTYGFDLASEIERLRTQPQLPGFLFAGFDAYPVRDERHIRYQVQFDVYNPTDVDGLIEVQVRSSGPGRGRRGGDDDELPTRLYRVNAGQAMQIGWVSDEQPSGVNINALLSQNLPLEYDVRLDGEEDRKPATKSFEGAQPVDWFERRRDEEGIVVDNVSEMFKHSIMRHESPLKRWIHGEPQDDPNDYDYFRWWYGPSQWKRLKFPSFYGRFVHSAYYTRAGSGERDVSWIADLPESGWYQIYIHVPDTDQLGGRRRGRDLMEKQTYVIDHANGRETIQMDLSEAPSGWNLLETYYFEEGSARITLTNESDGRLVLADAIKWVPKG